MPASPYASIHAAAMRRALNQPRYQADTITDPRCQPSAQALRIRDARVAASIIASIAFRSIVALHGDYPGAAPTFNGHTYR